ncbi:MAG: NUDIX hydrolase [Chloroflexi bacterium]|nr:NUDIX hydrolase [Chloroflexota bacterium]
MKSRKEVSAGGVVYRRTPGGFEVAICKDAGYHRWVLPKGLVRKNESLEAAALRETQEEIGVQARLVAPLGEPEQYIYTARGVRVFKSVHYFLMEYESGSISDHDAEMEEVRWLPLDEAIELLAYEGAKAILRRSRAVLTGDSAPPASGMES